MKEIFQTYGYYLEHVESTTLPGIDGLKVMGEIMTRVRENPPTEIGGVKVINPGTAGAGRRLTWALVEVFDNGGIACEIRDI